MEPPPRITKEIELFPRKFGKAALLLKSSTKDPGYIVFELNPRPVIAVMAVTTDQQVIVVRQYRYAANQGVIEVPGGLADGEEPSEEIARRELEEETGFTSDQLIRLTDHPIWYDPASVRTPFWLYLARDCEPLKQWGGPPRDEPLEVLRFPLSEWIKQIERGEILDAKTIVATFLALPHLRTH